MYQWNTIDNKSLFTAEMLRNFKLLISCLCFTNLPIRNGNTLRQRAKP